MLFSPVLTSHFIQAYTISDGQVLYLAQFALLSACYNIDT